MELEKVNGKICRVRLEAPLYATVRSNLYFFVLSVFKDMFDRDFDMMHDQKEPIYIPQSDINLSFGMKGPMRGSKSGFQFDQTWYVMIDGMWLETNVEFDSKNSSATPWGYDLYFVGGADDEEQAIKKVSSLTEGLWKGSGKLW